MSVLGPEPPGLSPLASELFAGLAALLEARRPALLDAGMTKATGRPEDGGVEVVLAHARDVRCSVWLQGLADRVVVGCSTFESSQHVAGALALVDALLCGEREVRGYDGSAFVPDFGARR